jgi:hypothetical protein
MQEARRQAELRRERMFGRPAQDPAAPASMSNGTGDGAGICELDEPADDDDDGSWVPDYGASAGDDIAVPIAPNAPDEGQVVLAVELAERRVAETEQYLDRSVNPQTLSIPLVVFSKLNRVIPQSETICAGWSAFIDAVAPTPARVVQEKKDVPYVIAGTLQEAPLSTAAQEELRRAGKDAVIGKARSNKHTASLGPAFLLDDDVIDGDVFDREAKLKALGIAGFIYSSHSYGFGKMGGRVGVCLNRPYAPDEHEPLWDGINHLLGRGFDKAGRTRSQCYGMHARRSNDAPHKRVVLNGAALNGDALVALGRHLMQAKEVLGGDPAPAAKDLPPDGFNQNECDFPPLPFKPIQEGCPFFADAYANHGKEHAQPLWHLTILAATFLENGEQFAHALGNEHPDYTPDTTQEMWARKIKEREERGLGWPGCQAFEDAGCTFCKTCQHHGKIKSPLNLAVPVIAKRDLARIIEEVKEGKRDPVVEVRRLHKRRAGNEAMFAVLNASYAVVRYGGEIVIANISRDDIILMKVENFHKMYANVRIKVDDRFIEISRLWFNWPGRRQYMRRGLVFEPDGKLDIPDDMLNLWRGFGIKPQQGDWSLLQDHILNVLCAGRRDLFEYVIKWMAYTVQHPSRPIGVAVAFRGAQGAGKGVVARTLGTIFGKHFAHIANGEQLTGRFNASLATSCLVFLDEALWAGDKKGEGVLKALITEPRLQLEAKYRDPIPVDNHTHIIVASNNDWFVPAGMGDRRWFILDVADTYAGTGQGEYFDPLYAEIANGGAEAMFYDLLQMDLSTFNVRAVPHTAAKAQQQAHSLRGTEAWLYNALHEGAIGGEHWQNDGLTVAKDVAYDDYVEFSKRQRDWRPDVRSVWSKKILELLGDCVKGAKKKDAGERVRVFKFAPLADCRGKFEAHIPNIEWEEPNHEQELVPSPNPVTPDKVTPPEVSPTDGVDADSPVQRANELGKSAWRGTL